MHSRGKDRSVEVIAGERQTTPSLRVSFREDCRWTDGTGVSGLAYSESGMMACRFCVSSEQRQGIRSPRS
jgi:hypothetical protein